ncbi:hypothetical protein Aab01nite_83270 [Paractinoplanes abujensis]|uniref:Polyhydroxyalkanoate synthesis regulator phasin n=1 Tax=Paractinoplanes abujensis TaxID=882441 RepID=A0A7W7FXD9_9ACTN|nr:hypothetical protein [Actinoplanes abujensis]MBB4689858.1 polyhydroxyalkanoate synthesis regulator phasin [Actinoplanes abujensis]GID24737.1 hypothetical protein Aab01nite_83270 [Actinoplanes abujensis]
MPDAWRAYLEMALGLTEAPRKRAQKVAGELVNRGGATAAQLQGLVDDLLSAGMANREALTNIVRYEVDKALGVVGLATAEEVTELTTRVRDLERQLREAESRAQGGPATGTLSEGVGGTRIDEPAPLPRKAVKKVAKKAAPNKMPSAGTTPATPPANTAPASEPSPAKKAAAVTPSPAKKAAAVTPSPAKKAAAVTPPPAKTTGAVTPAPAKKAVAKKAVAKKAPAKAVPPPDEVIPADVKATAKPAPATQRAEALGARPARKKAAAKKAVAKTTPPAPAGTADAPTAGVREAAAATELPPTGEA